MNNAIARILDGNGSSHGTAFAISSDLGLTAFHCIGNRETGEITLSTMCLLFPGEPGIEATVLAGDSRADFAVLHFSSQLPASLAPIPLTLDVMVHARFRCIGYPNLEGPDVTSSHGEVVAPDSSIFKGIAAIQLYSAESAADLSLQGMSGAPVLIGTPEAAIGIIRWNPPREPRSPLAIGGIAFACPVRSVVELQPDLKQYVIETTSYEISSTINEILKSASALFDVGLTDRQEKHEKEFEKSYLKQVAIKCGRVDTLGVRDLKEFGQQLTIAYVSLSVKKSTNQGDAGRLQAEEVLESEPLLTVRAPAGSGKTTLLNWIALSCAQGANTDANNRWCGGIPFLISLRSLKDQDEGIPDLNRLVDYTIDLKKWPNQPPLGWILKVLTDKRAVVMLDGLDELPSKFRAGFWSWVKNELMVRYGGNRIIITSRYLPASRDAADWQPPSDFVSAELDEMTNDDVRQFILNWHDSALEGETDPNIRANLESARDSLPSKLSDPVNYRVRELCGTPLLCSMICALHWREEGYLPGQRIELYERCVLMFVEERDRKRGIEPPPEPLRWITKDDKEMVLQRLAYTMMKNVITSEEGQARIEISREQAERWIVGWLPMFVDERARKCNSSEVLEHLLERSGLLREPVTGMVEYTHRSFQEYLAACAAGAQEVAGELANLAHDDQWHETIILAAGTKIGGVPFGRQLIKELLRRGEKQGWFNKATAVRQTCFALAIACLETAKQPGSELSERVLSHLKEIVPPRNASAAKSISAAGEAALPFLSYSSWKEEEEEIVTSCARAVRLINGAKATQMLVEYGSDQRESVLAEVAQGKSINVLNLAGVRKILVKEQPLPTSLQKFVADLRPLDDSNKHLALATPLIDVDSPALNNLRTLDLRGCTRITDLNPLAALQSLDSLDLSGCIAVRTFDPLVALKGLRTLKLEGTGIADLNPLAALQSLDSLDLSGCMNAWDLSPLTALKESLRTFRMASSSMWPDLNYYSSITDALTDALWVRKYVIRRRLTSFERGVVRQRNMDLSPLSRLSNLEVLDLPGWVSKKVLIPLKSIDNLHSLNISGWQLLSDLTPLMDLKNLQHLNLSWCEHVTDLSPLKALTGLQTLWLGGCKVTDLAPLLDIETLSRIYIDTEQLGDDVLPKELKSKAVVQKQFWKFKLLSSLLRKEMLTMTAQTDE